MQTDLIAKSIKSLWAGDGTVGSIPITYGRVQTLTNQPFASLVVKNTDVDIFSAGDNVVDYLVNIKVYNTQEIGPTGSLARTVSAIYDYASSLPFITGTLLLVLPVESDVEESDKEDVGKNVMVVNSSWLVKIQESRL